MWLNSFGSIVGYLRIHFGVPAADLAKGRNAQNFVPFASSDGALTSRRNLTNW
jgi:hypothetical protein